MGLEGGLRWCLPHDLHGCSQIFQSVRLFYLSFVMVEAFGRSSERGMYSTNFSRVHLKTRPVGDQTTGPWVNVQRRPPTLDAGRPPGWMLSDGLEGKYSSTARLLSTISHTTRQLVTSAGTLLVSCGGLG